MMDGFIMTLVGYYIDGPTKLGKGPTILDEAPSRLNECLSPKHAPSDAFAPSLV